MDYRPGGGHIVNSLTRQFGVLSTSGPYQATSEVWTTVSEKAHPALLSSTLGTARIVFCWHPVCLSQGVVDHDEVRDPAQELPIADETMICM